MRRRSALAMLTALALAACGSSPRVSYFVLDAVPGTRATASAAQPLQIGDINIPATLDRQSFVRRTGPDQLDISDVDRWAAPLDALIRRALADDLAQRLPQGKLVPSGAPAPNGTRRLNVTVTQFIGDGQGHVVLAADWVLRGAHTLSGSETLHADAANGTAQAIAQTMSTLLGRFADRIAERAAGGA